MELYGRVRAGVRVAHVTGKSESKIEIEMHYFYARVVSNFCIIVIPCSYGAKPSTPIEGTTTVVGVVYGQPESHLHLPQ